MKLSVALILRNSGLSNDFEYVIFGDSDVKQEPHSFL